MKFLLCYSLGLLDNDLELDIFDVLEHLDDSEHDLLPLDGLECSEEREEERPRTSELVEFLPQCQLLLQHVCKWLSDSVLFAVHDSAKLTNRDETLSVKEGVFGLFI